MPIFFNKVNPIEPIVKKQSKTNTFADLVSQHRASTKQNNKAPGSELTVEKPIRDNKTSAYMRDLTNK